MSDGIQKKCGVCGKLKPLHEFHRDRKSNDGRTGRCRSCMLQYASERYRRIRPARGERRSSPLSASELATVRESGVLRCCTCRKEKPLDQYHKHVVNGRSYIRRTCGACNNARTARWREHNRKELNRRIKERRCSQYGLTGEQYDAMLAGQKINCAVCGRPLGQKHQTIDHDHVTGRVRGIVHRNCNLMLGNARENIAVLADGIRYLLKAMREEPVVEPLAGLIRLVTRVEIKP